MVHKSQQEDFDPKVNRNKYCNPIRLYKTRNSTAEAFRMETGDFIDQRENLYDFNRWENEKEEKERVQEEKEKQAETEQLQKKKEEEERVQKEKEQKAKQEEAEQLQKKKEEQERVQKEKEQKAKQAEAERQVPSPHDSDSDSQKLVVDSEVDSQATEPASDSQAGVDK